MSSLSNLFSSAAQASEFTRLQQELFRARNQDLRTLDHSKALHSLAEVLGFSNWHAMKHALDRLSAPMPDDASSEVSPQNAMAMSVLEDIDTLSRRYGEIDVDDTDELQELHDNFDSDGLLTSYGSGLTVTVNIAIASGTGIHFVVDPEDKEVQSAEVAVSGFEGVIRKPVPAQHLEALSRRFADQIDAELMTLITG